MNNKVRIKVLDILGRHVKLLFDRYQTVGKYNLQWNGIDQRNKQVSTGVYIILLEVGDISRTQKIVLAK